MAGSRYAVGGRSLDTAATADHVAAQLWNPHGTKAIYVREVHLIQIAATVSNPGLARSSARGATPTATVTPDLDNHFDRLAAPASAAVLELATFGTQPTLSPPYLFRYNFPAAGGAGLIWTFYDTPLLVPAGTGLCIATPVAVVLQDSDITFVWDE